MMKILISEYKGKNVINYTNALMKAGVDIGYFDDYKSPEEYDGLLIPGGGDIDPSFYNQENKGSIDPDIDLDNRQLKVLDDFIRKEKPVFGICRGHQLVNVYFEGTLIQDLGEELNKVHRKIDFSGPDKVNTIKTVKGSILNDIYGDIFKSNSSHHQAVDKVGKGLKVTAVSDDGVIEALEHESLPVFTVQFHPERMNYNVSTNSSIDPDIDKGYKLINYFIDFCKRS
ncbi:MAG: gamma-glutamyl-gamma-aminobutyrate hydrolase family protein [Erysipelotrichaceae bacterium]|nr:gamma-glutamyl-gamma-aminobutyrate hydrolase family protein [Erysipelotrichaceae bacterium]